MVGSDHHRCPCEAVRADAEAGVGSLAELIPLQV